MTNQPYQFGDVVQGHRWTVAGWEPVEPAERSVGVPRLLEARYAASQEAIAREQRRTQVAEQHAPTVVDTDVRVPAGTVVAAPDLAVDFDEPADDEGDGPTAGLPSDEPTEADAEVTDVRTLPSPGWYPGSV